MPHVIVKLWPDKSEQQKNRLAEAITKTLWHSALRRRVGFGSDGRSEAPGLGRESLQTRH
jgi:hypothetical protein